MTRDKTYKVQCLNGHECNETVKNVPDGSTYGRPYKCGTCGTYDISVWELVYDAITDIVRGKK